MKVRLNPRFVPKKPLFTNFLQKHKGHIQLLVWGLVIFSLAIFLINLPNFQQPQDSQASGFNISSVYPNVYPITHNHQKEITVTNDNSSALDDFQVKIELNTQDLIEQGKMREDCGDVRIKTTVGNSANLPYWIRQETCDTENTEIWFKADILPVGQSKFTLTFGNPTLPSNSDGNQVFEFFDDFSRRNISSTRWDQGVVDTPSGGDWDISEGNLVGGNNNRYLTSKQTFSGNFITEARVYTTTVPANGFATIGFWGGINTQLTTLSHGNDNLYYRNNSTWVNNTGINQTGYWAIDRVFGMGSNSKVQRYNETTNSLVLDATVDHSGLSNKKVFLGARGDLHSHNQEYNSKWDWVFVRKGVSQEITTSLGIISPPSQNITIDGEGFSESMLYNDAEPDPNFNLNNISNTGFNSTVMSTAVQKNGRILVGGSFWEFNGSTQRGLIRLNRDGTKDTSFDIGDGFREEEGSVQIRDIIVQEDEKILVAGHFDTFDNSPVRHLIRLNPDGTRDTSFYTGTSHTTGFNDSVESISLQEDGKIIAVGWFGSFDNQSQGGIIRLNPDGTKDTSFDVGTGINTWSYASAIQADGKILIGGDFTQFNGQSQNYLVRLNSDGSKDTSFDIGTGFSSHIHSIYVQPDEKILVGGTFTQFNGSTQNRLIRLNPDGSKDNSFDIGSGFVDPFFNTIYDIAVQSDGKILVGGYFTQFNGSTQNRLIRLNPDGSKDNSFDIGSGFNGYAVQSVTIQPNGQILVGGDFTGYQGQSARRLTRLGFVDQIVLTIGGQRCVDVKVPSSVRITCTLKPGYQVQAFTETGSHTWQVPAGVTRADVLVVGGGGGGGGVIGGGGGAGGLIFESNYNLNPDSQINISVGQGGEGGTGWNTTTQNGKPGQNSSFANLTAIGGGGGFHYGGNTTSTQANGGSGGGGANGSPTGVGGNNTAGQGNIGGFTDNKVNQGAGGGGAGGAGGDNHSQGGGAGGEGLFFGDIFGDIFGDNGWFASGGSGGVRNGHGTPGEKKSGGGGAGTSTSIVAENGMENTGGGGGGAGYHSSSSAKLGGDGGSGIVLVRYFQPIQPGLADIVITARSDGQVLHTLNNAYQFVNYGNINPDGMVAFYDAQNPDIMNGQTIRDLSGENNTAVLGTNSNVESSDPSHNAEQGYWDFNGSQIITSSLSSDFGGVLNGYGCGGYGGYGQTGYGSGCGSSFELWIKKNENATSEQRFLNTYSGASSSRHILRYHNNNIQHLSRRASDGGFTTRNSDFILASNWEMITYTIDEVSGEAKFYVNGVLQDTLIQDYFQAADFGITIGGFRTAGSNGFQGKIASVRIYNRILDEFEIQTNFDNDQQRFGFGMGEVAVQTNPNNALGSIPVSSSTQYVNVNLSEIVINDRRRRFEAFNVNISIEDLALSTNPNQKIGREKVSLNIPTPTVESGSIENITVSSFVNFQASPQQPLFQQSASSGGGRVILNPVITIEVPPFSNSGSYQGRIILDIF